MDAVAIDARRHVGAFVVQQRLAVDADGVVVEDGAVALAAGSQPCTPACKAGSVLCGAGDAAVVATPAPVAMSASRRPRVQAMADGAIEITLPDGTTVRVGRAVGAVALRRILEALRG